MDKFNLTGDSLQRYQGRCECPPTPFVYRFKNGVEFRIDNIGVIDHKWLVEQNLEGEIQIKFCITEDEDYQDSDVEDVEHFKVILFPWYTKTGEENVHGEIIPYEDSILNGNITIEKGKVTDLTTNHNDRDYRILENQLLEYVSDYILDHLNDRYEC